MRSARLLLVTATATAALAIAAPGALAADGGDWEKGDSSYSKEHDKDSKQEKPNGGMHTGGGALTAVNEGDWSKGDSADETKKDDWETDKEEGSKGSWNSTDKEETEEKAEGGKGDWSSKHEKPSGGMHTGGGALAAPGVTAGGLAALAVVGAGAFAMRRRNAADGVS